MAPSKPSSPSRPPPIWSPSPAGSGTPGTTRRACLCAPTTHPGSFRCSLHRDRRKISARGPAPLYNPKAGGGGRGERGKARSMRALLMQIIRPSNYDLRRRGDFQRRPTRFGPMGDGDQGSRPSVLV